MSEERIWRTAITEVKPNRILIRGYRQEDLIGRLSFADTVYLLIKGEIPDEKQSEMMEAMLVACADHGVSAPSCLVARLIASTGSTLTKAVSGGLSTIDRFHGGAIESCMEILRNSVQRMKTQNIPLSEVSKTIIDEMKQHGKRMPGLGHWIHKDDPRVKKLLLLAKELEIYGDHGRMLEAIRDTYTEVSKIELPINIDGAIASILADMGFDTRVGNGVFLIGRAAGLVAHVYEEITREKPMREICRVEYEYDGPSEREVS